ncbi:MAG: LppX_LprAFG lipoprotein [Nocardioidaceae bacterium]
MSLPLRLLAAALALPLVLAGCSGGDDAPEAKPDTLKPRLETARKTLDGATSLSFRLSTSKLPSGVTGLLEAQGKGNHQPAFDGKVKISTGGTTLDADVVAVGGTVYAKLGFSPSFVPIDPKSVGAPDPASLMATEDGVSSLLTSTERLQQGDRSRDGADVLTSIEGVLPGDVVQRLIPSADSTARFDATYRLTDDDVLRDATIEGPFYPGGDNVSYTIEVTASDENVDITAP